MIYHHGLAMITVMVVITFNSTETLVLHSIDPPWVGKILCQRIIRF